MPENEPDATPAPERSPVSETPGHALAWRWFNAYVANSPASRNADAINHISAIALPALIDAVDAALLATKG